MLFLPDTPEPTVNDRTGPEFVPNDKPPVLDGFEPLVEACKAAKTTFRPITEKDVAEANQQLRGALARLDEKLEQAGSNGHAWKKYLLWEVIGKHLDGDSEASLVKLDRVYARFAGNEPGLRLVIFADARRALRCYLETARAVGDHALEAKYRERMDNLIGHLHAYAAAPSANHVYRICQDLAWLKRAHQAPDVIKAIHERFGQPNLHWHVSANLVDTLIERPVERTEPVRDMILETSISGTSETTGLLTARLVPDDDRALIEILLDATADSRTLGRNGPAIIHSASVTSITARKRIWLDANGFGTEPAETEATTQTTTTGIGSTRGSQFVERVARRRVQEKKYIYQSISSAHTEARVDRQLNHEVKRHVNEANEAFQEKIRRPLVWRGLYPDPLTFQTRGETLCMAAMQAGAFQLGSPTEAPEVNDQADLVIRIHESMVNNLADAALTGATMHEDALRKSAHKLLGFVPRPLESHKDQPAWALTFAQARPIVVSFHEDKFRVTLRGQRFFRGEETHPGMNVSAAYRLEIRDDCLVATRQGDLEILPPDIMPGQERKLSVREKVLCDMLDIRFDRVLPETLEGRGFTPRGRLRKIGKLVPFRVESQNGWLSIAWKRAKADTVLTALP